jgi:hypothetical protein
MTAGKLAAIGAIVAVVAFGAAFGIGSATKGSGSKASAPSPVQAFKPDSAQTQLVSYQPSGALPAPKKAKKKKTPRKPAGGGGGGGGGGSAPSAPVTPPPSRPSTPAPSSPPPSRPPSGGGGGGGSGGSG